MGLCKKHDTVTAYIFSQDFTKILLVSKRFSKRLMPPGGHVEKNESFIDAMFREIYEETGIEAKYLSKQHFNNILSNDNPHYSVSLPIQDEEFVVLEKLSQFHYHMDHIYCFTLANDYELKQMKSLEISRINWIELKDINSLKFYPNVYDTINFFWRSK